MSAPFVQKIYNEKLKSLYSKSFRDELQDRKGQALILRDIKDFERVFVKYGINFDDTSLGQIYNAGIVKAKSLHKVFIRNHPNLAKVFANKLINRKLATRAEIGKTVFILSNWDSLNLVKKAMLDEAADINPTITANRKDISSAIHRGHGTVGQAVSQLSIAEGFRYLAKTIGVKKLNQLFEEADFAAFVDMEGSEFSAITKLKTEYKHMITPNGELKANYVSVITFQEGVENLKDSAQEKALKDLFFRKFAPYFVNQILELKGNDNNNLKKQIASQTLGKVVKSLQDLPNVEVKLSPDLKAKRSSAGKATTGGKTKGASKTVVRTPKKANVKLPKEEEDVSPINLRNLIPVINRKLPKVVADNMGSPRLNYRTGRFANSVKVTDITRTPKGFPSIAYDYMRDPYEVFEHPGGSPKLSSVDRDPRNLIDASIREIARTLITQRFFTRKA